MSFAEQSKRAQSISNAYRQNYNWSNGDGGPQRSTPGVTYGSRYADYHLEQGFNAAYASPDGYAIFKSPITGKNEMFVRGTTMKGYGREWASNALEAAPRWFSNATGYAGTQQLSFYHRKRYAKHLDTIAQAHDVHTVYGHSRGAAIVADMRHPRKKVGVDGAMLLANRGERNFTNYRQSQPFDYAIGWGGRNNHTVKGPWNPRSRRFHKAYLHD